MLGAIAGDIIGSPYEFGGQKRKDFPLFGPGCRPTDDSIITIAVGCACVEADCRDEYDFKQTLIRSILEIGMRYPDAGYGREFYRWMEQGGGSSYGSYGNGSAMRVSPVAWVADSLDQALCLAKWSAEITHDHPEGIRGAQAVAAAIYLARTGEDKQTIRTYIQENFYDLDFTLDDIRPGYGFDLRCEGSVPQAIICFLESRDFEDAVRNAVSLGGDSDTQGCIAGAIAEAYYGVPDAIGDQALEYLDEDLLELYSNYAQELYE